ncbi:MAG: FtsW/RodA/SpoVE family cell cycle protein [Clostridia bacterium]|nr:FtsW/RodA/SpoVE family cell cycle protein [Clostridia bacterium]
MQRERIDEMRQALMRSNTRLLLSAVMMFQAAAMGLIAFQSGTVNVQALILAVAMPTVTALTASLMGRLWPVDRAILILVMFLCSLGIITLSDIARADVTPRTQAIYALAGLCAMFVGAALIRGFRAWKRFTPALMVLCVLALMSPYLPVVGVVKNGARNWVGFRGMSVQPSEFMKPVMILCLAGGFANRPRFVKCLPTIGFAAVCCGILLMQRDLGAVLLYFLTTVFMYYAATSNAFIALSGLGMGAGAAVLAYRFIPLVQTRVELWRNPWSDPTNKGLQLVQALIAIGSGGLFGMGLGLGRPRSIPLYYSDFIFAAITEEFGLIFAIGLLTIYVLIIMRGLIVAFNARTSFHSLASFGLVVILGLQTMLIVGGNTKLIPLTGVTLPLVCYGGSSLVSTFFSMGVLLGISSMNAEDEGRDIEKLEMKEAMS